MRVKLYGMFVCINGFTSELKRKKNKSKKTKTNGYKWVYEQSKDCTQVSNLAVLYLQLSPIISLIIMECSQESFLDVMFVKVSLSLTMTILANLLN